MSLTYTEARDEINGVFLSAWNAAGNVVGYVPEIRWAGAEERDSPDGSKYWCRVSIQTLDDEQSSLSTCVGKPGQRRFTAYGLVFVQLFCPKSDSRASELGGKLAEIARNAFRKKATENGVWFRNSRINEISDEDRYVRYNVVAELEYDEIF